MIVIAVDPGGTTGWAEYDTDERHLRAFGQIDDWEVAVDFLIERAPQQFVVESFHITGQTLKLARSYDALYLIGALGHAARKVGTPVTMQTPSTRQFATQRKLDALGWKPRGDHAIQAARHLLTWLFENGHITAEALRGDS